MTLTRKRLLLSAVTVCALSVSGARGRGQIEFVSFDQVRLSDGFLAPRLETNRRVTVPHNLDKCAEVGIIDNFTRAAGRQAGQYVGLCNWDEFLYKAIEAASYSLRVEYDEGFDRRLDEIIDVIGAAQEEDGYLRTVKTLARRYDPADPDNAKWANLKGDLELYCAGHLFEAAVAHHQATGKTTLLSIARKKADLIDRVFGPGRNEGVPGHEEIELALVRLYEATDDERYLKLSQFFVDQRGNADGHQLYGSFFQDHEPIIEQDEAVGQAPRATYLYCGMADVAYHRGNKAYIRALDRLWEDVVGRKMYITGGIGSLHSNEGFGPPYELPNQTAYTEVCAAISFPMWNQRMFKLHRDAKYIDLMELTLYNNFLAGVSLSGDRYFYACPPESDGKYEFNLGWCPDGFDVPYREPAATRKEWFPCACCPPSLARYMFQIPGMFYAVDRETIYVNMFAASEAEVTVGGIGVRIVQETDYPWDGRVRISVTPVKASRLTLKIRMPGWALGRPVPSDLYRYAETRSEMVQLRRNGVAIPVELERGFVTITDTWHHGDVIDLMLPMKVRQVLSHPKVKENAGKVALQRGPIVYCAEGIDNDGKALDICIADDTELVAEFCEGFLGGVTVLRGRATRAGVSDEEVPFLAIPYCVWSNRGVGEMVIWLKRAAN